MKRKKKQKSSKFIKKCPLALILILSVAILTVIGIYGVYRGFIKDPSVSFEKPFVTGVVSGEMYDNYVDALNNKYKKPSEYAPMPSPGKDSYKKETKAKEAETTTAKSENKPTPSTPSVPAGTVIAGNGVTKYVSRPACTPRSPYYDDTQKTPLTTEANYKTVGDDYFQDALFIGDSRIEGLCYYGNLPASFAYKTGVNVFNIAEGNIADETCSGTNTTLVNKLSQKTYGKVYIMIGINELGFNTSDGWGAAYGDLLNLIRQYQPNAKIFIFSIMNVTQSYSDGDNCVNNDAINSRNCRSAEYANGKDIFYLDVNTVTNDANGALNAAYTSDGYHLRAEYYYIWVDFIKQHGI